MFWITSAVVDDEKFVKDVSREVLRTPPDVKVDTPPER